MHDWNTWEWAAYIVPNLCTAWAYYYIPYRLGRRKNELTDPTSIARNTILFRAFIGACGTHHLLHAFLMKGGFFWLLMMEAMVVCFVSILAALKLEL